MYKSILAIGALAATAICGFATPGLAAHGATPSKAQAKAYAAQLAHTKQVNNKYVFTGVARAAGYGLLKDAKGIECIADSMGGMGVHLVNGTLVGDSRVVASKPEALVYEPDKKGKLHLVAAEYVVFASKWNALHKSPPSLYGHPFALVPAGNRYGLPAFYELHAWMWKHNSMGTFKDFNMSVSCAGSTERYR
jgi:hypothetical protein